MTKKRIFVGFDFDNDRHLKDFIIVQTRNPDSPFEVADFSLKESQPEWNWEIKARQAIQNANVFIVMLGPKTRYASGVRKEVTMAAELRMRSFQIIGHSYGSVNCAVPNGGRVYRWSWPNLRKLLS